MSDSGTVMGPQGSGRGVLADRERALPWLLCAALLATLRFYRLGDWSLWIDEAYTLADAYHGDGNYNMLGYMLIRLVSDALGHPVSELALRLGPALAGWLVVPLTWWALRPLLGSARAAQVSLLVALSPWQLYWSQNARFYTFVECSSLFGAGLVFRGLSRGALWLTMVGLAVAAGGALFHLQGALVACGLGLGPWLAGFVCRGEGRSGRDDWCIVARRASLLAALGMAVCIPWVLGVFEQYRHVKGTSALSSLVHLVRSTAYFMTPVISAAVVLGAITVARRRDRRELTLLMCVLVSAAALVGASTFARGTAQYGLALMPLCSALALAPLDSERLREWAAGRVGYLILLCAPLASGTLLYFTVHQGQRPRWREAYLYVADARGPDDLVLGMQASVGEYYLNPGSTDLRSPTEVARGDRTNAHIWRRWRGRGRTIWIVVRPEFLMEWPRQERRDFEGFLREECRLMRRFDVRQEGRDLEVVVYRHP